MAAHWNRTVRHLSGLLLPWHSHLAAILLLYRFRTSKWYVVVCYVDRIRTRQLSTVTTSRVLLQCPEHSMSTESESVRYANLFRDASDFEFLSFSYLTNEHGRRTRVIYSIGENTKDKSSTLPTFSDGMPKMLASFRQFLAIVWLFHRVRSKTSSWVWRYNLEVIARNVHSVVIVTCNMQYEFDWAKITFREAYTILKGYNELADSSSFTTVTLVYLIASSQFVLINGIIPSRCAMNSSGRTVVLISMTTMSMAAKLLITAVHIIRGIPTHSR